MRGVEAGSLFTEPLSTGEGLARIRAAFERIRTTKPIHTNAMFGPMSREEVEQLNLRHAELHLGFFHPR
jgi:DNA-binding response OmpR family regulator